jgi:hypothetical protein
VLFGGRASSLVLERESSEPLHKLVQRVREVGKHLEVRAARCDPQLDQSRSSLIQHRGDLRFEFVRLIVQGLNGLELRLCGRGGIFRFHEHYGE